MQPENSLRRQSEALRFLAPELQRTILKWWPETGWNRRRRPFQGRLASNLSSLESADIIETISLVASSF
jgi:hypothetical protein